MPEKPILKNLFQVAVVVSDLDEAVRKSTEIYGLGPWTFHEANASNRQNMTVRGKRIDHAYRVALCKIGNISWELIQPLDEKSIYAEHLRKHGDGLHHVAAQVENFDETKAYLKDKGIEVLQGGVTDNGTEFAYLDTEGTFGAILEIFKRPGEG